MTQYIDRYTSAAPLVVFRIIFGLLLFIGIIRFWANGWIYELYIKPQHFFSYYGFEFVRPLGNYTYFLFTICAVSALFVAFGFFYRISSIVLFLSFTYIELIDKTTYLNHYYFISTLAFLMMFLPAHVYFSVDAYRHPAMGSKLIPNWSTDSIRLLVTMLYFFAGLAKINSDWLIEAMPLRLWLPAKNDLPLIGWSFNYPATHYVFSWFGCVYDLSIPFLLWNSKTRPMAFLAVIVFHVLTSLLFPIGMFPYIMIGTALIFFSDGFHKNIIRFLIGLFSLRPIENVETLIVHNKRKNAFIIGVLAIFFVIQLFMPFRYLLYPGQVFWTEQGFRFSWRVMLMEKSGLATFKVKDETGKYAIANNRAFLSPMQEKMMATQPDMILQYAHILRDYYVSIGFDKPQVYVDSYVTLNGRRGRPMIDPNVDLALEKESFHHKPWILLYNE